MQAHQADEARRCRPRCGERRVIGCGACVGAVRSVRRPRSPATDRQQWKQPMSATGGELSSNRCQRHVNCCCACVAYFVAIVLVAPASSSPCMPPDCLSVLGLVPAALRLLVCEVLAQPRLSPVTSLLEPIVLLPSAHSPASFPSLPPSCVVSVFASLSAVLSLPLLGSSSVSASLRVSSHSVAASVCCCREPVHEGCLLSSSPSPFPSALLLVLLGRLYDSRQSPARLRLSFPVRLLRLPSLHRSPSSAVFRSFLLSLRFIQSRVVGCHESTSHPIRHVSCSSLYADSRCEGVKERCSVIRSAEDKSRCSARPP